MDVVMYTMRCNGYAVDTKVVGPIGNGLWETVLGIAARQSFVKRMPVTILENGHPLRVVNVSQP